MSALPSSLGSWEGEGDPQEVAARRAGGNSRAVHEELVAIVAGRVNHKVLRFCRQIERPVEVVDAIVERRRRGHGNPAPTPGPPQELRVHGRRGLRCGDKARRSQEGQGRQQDENQRPGGEIWGVQCSGSVTACNSFEMVLVSVSVGAPGARFRGLRDPA